MVGPLIGMYVCKALKQKRVASGREREEAAHPHIPSHTEEAAAQAPGLFKKAFISSSRVCQNGFVVLFKPLLVYSGSVHSL